LSLGPDFLRGHRDPAPLFPGVPTDLKRSCFLVVGGCGFAPREERHVHRNHVVRAVRLVEVNG
jgi:hypothetical protein